MYMRKLQIMCKKGFSSGHIIITSPDMDIDNFQNYLDPDTFRSIFIKVQILSEGLYPNLL